MNRLAYYYENQNRILFSCCPKGGTTVAFLKREVRWMAVIQITVPLSSHNG
jgi:hypothetical protein